MNILFQMVHPAKYHFHKIAINKLIENGHNVEVLIQTKDMLEFLVKKENWKYKNLFPSGRKISFLPKILSNIVILIITIFRQLKYVHGKSFDLFVGGELGIVGKLKDTPSIYVTDDDMFITPQQHHACLLATHILTPEICDMTIYNSKRITYKGYKALSHLHPNYFTPSIESLNDSVKGHDFFMIRVCSYNSVHDVGGINGIDDKSLIQIVNFLKDKGKIVISNERKVPEEVLKYCISPELDNIENYLYHAKIFIGDSTTMCSEAAVLGTPSVEYDDWWYRCAQMLEIQEKYKYNYGVKPGHIDSLLEILNNILNAYSSGLISKKEQIANVLDNCDDVSEFQTLLYSNYDKSLGYK